MIKAGDLYIEREPRGRIAYRWKARVEWVGADMVYYRLEGSTKVDQVTRTRFCERFEKVESPN